MGLTTHDLLKAVYGISGAWRENPLVDAVQVAVTRLLPLNPNRLAFLLINLSANTIYVSPRENVSATNGILVNANGGSLLVQWDKDLILPTLNYYAVAGANNSSIYILEIVAN